MIRRERLRIVFFIGYGERRDKCLMLLFLLSICVIQVRGLYRSRGYMVYEIRLLSIVEVRGRDEIL